MTRPLRLHYAPDNASLCVRLLLEAIEATYETVLVDRRAGAQKSEPYLRLNPNGLIPVLETDHGLMFETGAILLWLADRTPGRWFPAPDDPQRGADLTWHVWLANTLHPALRMLFYPAQYLPDQPEALRPPTRENLRRHLDVLNAASPAFLFAEHPTAQGCYLAPMLRWAGLYGGDTSWFELCHWPHLHAFARRFETFEVSSKVSALEGLGPNPFSAPQPPNPPEGSAL